MRLLDRYLLRELLVPLAYCLGGFLVFYVAFDLIFEIGRFQDRHLLFMDVVEYYVVTLPEILSDQVIPVSLLLACLYALTNHSRHNELTAMRAAGVSLWRLSLPYLAVGMAGGMAIFALNELWVPQAAERSKDILERRTNPTNDRNWTGRLDFHNEAERRHWNMAHFNRVTSEMIGPTVTWETTDGASHQIFAQRGIYTNGLWQFSNVEQWDREPGDAPAAQTTNSILDIKLSETPASIRTEIKVSSLPPTEAVKGPQLSIRELITYLRWHPHLDPQKKSSIKTQLQGRLTAPFTCLAVVLIALPFGARTGRQNVFVGVAGSIFICFAYFILQRISFGLGIAGYLPPAVAAWLPNVLFGSVGLGLMAGCANRQIMVDSDYQLVRLANGSFSVRSLAEGETFHPVIGPVAEAQALYVNQLKLRERVQAQTGEFVIWDVGLGAAANVLTALRATRNLPCALRVISFDHTIAPLEFALRHAAELGYVTPYENPIRELLKTGSAQFKHDRQSVHWQLHLGDFPKFIRQPATIPEPHAIMFDAFSPAKNPAMWTAPLFADLFRSLDPHRPCAMPTYSRSTMLRVSLLLAGFYVGVGHATGEKEETTLAANTLELLDEPLPAIWLKRARLSKSAEPLWEPVYRQAHLTTETWEKLRQHPQFL